MSIYNHTWLPCRIDVDALCTVVDVPENILNEYRQRQAEQRAKRLEWNRQYHNSEIAKAKRRAYLQRPEVKAHKNEMQRAYRARKKAEKEQQQRATQDNV